MIFCAPRITFISTHSTNHSVEKLPRIGPPRHTVKLYFSGSLKFCLSFMQLEGAAFCLTCALWNRDTTALVSCDIGALNWQKNCTPHNLKRTYNIYWKLFWSNILCRLNTDDIYRYILKLKIDKIYWKMKTSECATFCDSESPILI